MNKYKEIQLALKQNPKKWVITGVAGFIGSNLLEALLELDQFIVGMDNFSTGNQKNLDHIKKCVSKDKWNRFLFIEGDILDPKLCNEICQGSDYVLHQAALGSVPRSINDPVSTNAANINGFLNVLEASRKSNVRSLYVIRV